MKHLFEPPGERALRALVKRRPLLAFDYDGTLAPIVRSTVDAWLPRRTQLAWARLCDLAPCAVVSGRGVADLRRRMAGSGRCLFIGNHGIETSDSRTQARHWEKRTQAWVQFLKQRLVKYPGVEVEGKRFSLSVHWRGAPQALGLTAKVRRVCELLEGARLIGGKQVLNVVPDDAPNKGEALWAAMKRHGLRHALFVGDDVTDEDGFALSEDQPVLGVRVGRRANSRAQFFLNNQAEVNVLLDKLATLLASTSLSSEASPWASAAMLERSTSKSRR